VNSLNSHSLGILEERKCAKTVVKFLESQDERDMLLRRERKINPSGVAELILALGRVIPLLDRDSAALAVGEVKRWMTFAFALPDERQCAANVLSLCLPDSEALFFQIMKKYPLFAFEAGLFDFHLKNLNNQAVPLLSIFFKEYPLHHQYICGLTDRLVLINSDESWSILNDVQDYAQSINFSNDVLETRRTPIDFILNESSLGILGDVISLPWIFKKAKERGRSEQKALYALVRLARRFPVTGVDQIEKDKKFFQMEAIYTELKDRNKALVLEKISEYFSWCVENSAAS